MKLDSKERIISVQTCTEDNDILLASKKGQSIRFNVDKVRVFASRSSTCRRSRCKYSNFIYIEPNTLAFLAC